MRRHLRELANTHISARGKNGATLVEVLMSLLIMSIGITSVFYLFPIALLSSIKANQLTNTRILAEQAYSMIQIKPSLILGTEQWKPSTDYALDFVISPDSGLHSNFPNTQNHYYQVTTAGRSDAVEPDWDRIAHSISFSTIVPPPSYPLTDGTVQWTPVNLPHRIPPAQANLYVPSRYVVDPYGFANEFVTTNKSLFGNFGGNPSGAINRTSNPTDGQIPTQVLRTNSGLTPNRADYYNFCLPDTWSVLATAFPLSSTPVDFNSDGIADAWDIALPSTIDTTSIAPFISRAVTFSDGREQSAAGTITGVDNGTNTIRVDAQIIKTPSQPGLQIRIETFTPRYTWLAAVRRNSLGLLSYQIAVVFNRRYRSEDEELFDCTIREDIDTERTTIQIPASAQASEGGYVFDACSVRWYRITSRSGDLITIDQSLESINNNTQTRMMFLPGIVTVLSIDQ